MSEKKGLLSLLNFDSIIDNLTGYVEKRIALFKIELKEDLAEALSKLIVLTTLTIILSMVLLFLSLSLAFYLGDIFENITLGFLSVAGFYLFLFLIFILLNKQMGLEEALQSKFLSIFKNLNNSDGDD